jgi:hypothetical protein
MLLLINEFGCLRAREQKAREAKSLLTFDQFGGAGVGKI